eukprot:1153605-Pelagomonas_calceolata.AAC.4
MRFSTQKRDFTYQKQTPLRDGVACIKLHATSLPPSRELKNQETLSPLSARTELHASERTFEDHPPAPAAAAAAAAAVGLLVAGFDHGLGLGHGGTGEAVAASCTDAGGSKAVPPSCRPGPVAAACDTGGAEGARAITAAPLTRREGAGLRRPPLASCGRRIAVGAGGACAATAALEWIFPGAGDDICLGCAPHGTCEGGPGVEGRGGALGQSGGRTRVLSGSDTGRSVNAYVGRGAGRCGYG